jgi:peptidoglycan-associated lipoprotein
MPRSLVLLLLVPLLGGCPGKPKYPACEGDKDCGESEKCVNKHCQECATDGDCGEGKTCEKGACQAKPGWCSADGDCAGGQVCKEHACVACGGDDECGEGGRCRAGSCLRKGQCDSDEDCAEDEDCLSRVCVKGGREAVSSSPGCTLSAVFFGFDQYTLTDEAKTTLGTDVSCLSTTPLPVAVVGHTDPRGTVEYNIGLSDDRAQAVVTYLIRLGVDPARLHKVPKGATEATGVDEATYARDRRVELTWE